MQHFFSCNRNTIQAKSSQANVYLPLARNQECLLQERQGEHRIKHTISISLALSLTPFRLTARKRRNRTRTLPQNSEQNNTRPACKASKLAAERDNMYNCA